MSLYLKTVNQRKSFKFLREMEFNRLLSQAISFYGEDRNKHLLTLKLTESKDSKNKYQASIKVY